MSEEKIKLQQFFQNFLAQEKIKKNISEEYLNFLKIFWLSFNDIIQKNKNQRKLYILEQIEKFLTDENFRKEVESTQLPNQSEIVISQNSQTPIVKLKEIDLINFRGFQANDNGNGRKINFHEKATLFFAPNGGGKTSLCEALEWALTGDSLERTEREIAPINYFQNSNKNEPNFNTTKLTLTDSTISIPNPIFDRCFLEKNRIDRFAKLAIQSNSKMQEALGELFGFSDIAIFLNEFGQNLDPTDNEKRTRENWRTWIEWNTKKEEQEKEVEKAKEEENNTKDSLDKLLKNKSFDTRKEELEYEEKILRAELEAIKKDVSTEFSAEHFQERIIIFNSKIAKWKEYQEKISQNASDLDFESLFQTASIIFQRYEGTKCPLCDTPFEQNKEVPPHSCVVTDPRKKTTEELEKLRNLTNWKKEKTDLETDLQGISFREIRDDWQKIQQNLIENNWKAIAGEKEKPIIPEIDFSILEAKLGQEMKTFTEACKTSFGVDFSILSEVEEAISNYKKNREKILKAKTDKETRIEELQQELNKLDEQNRNFSTKQEIKRLNEEKLQKIIDQSNNSIGFKKLLDVYELFYNSIQRFQSSSILEEGAEIDEYVTGFYRALNLYDHDGEKVKTVHFPKNTEEEFCIKYEKDEGKTCNALNLLSEGHLRTLGLATLLARAMKYKTSLLIFDDAINAIDSDHRDNIASLLSDKFTKEDGENTFHEKWEHASKFLNECQLIITTHDRFFDEKVANLIKKEEQKRYVLYSGKTGIDFCENGNLANFEAKIENFLKPETQDIRSAIFYCRIWLEELLLEIALKFKKPSNNKPIEFTNIIEKKTKQLKNPELVVLIDKLIANLKANETNNEDNKVAGILEEIFKEKDKKYVWLFEILNQESHYRRFNHIDISNASTSQEVIKIFSKIQEINSIYSTVTS